MSELDEQFTRARRAALGIVGAQSGVALFCGVIGWFLAGPHEAVSALMGGGIGTLASFVQVAGTFRRGASRKPERILGRLYRGEALKLLVTAGLFACVLMSVEVSFGAMISSFAATFLVYWAALLWSSSAFLGPGPTRESRK